MGIKHQDKAAYLKKKAMNSPAFAIAVTAWNHCSWYRVNNNPPDKLWNWIMDSVQSINKCGDTHRRKELAKKECWAAYWEVAEFNKWAGLKQRAGVQNANQLDCSYPDTWGNALCDPVQRNNRWVRPIETLSMDVSYFNVLDEGDSDQLEINDQESPFTNAHFEFEGDMLEEELDEEVWRPEDNQCAF